jgi:hypothetical protein
VNVADADAHLARYLAAEGALVPTDRASTFEVPSLVVRAVLCARVLPLERRQPPADPVPTVGGVVQVGPMLLTALRYFDRRVCVDRRLFKKSAAPGVTGTFATQEDGFQTVSRCLESVAPS